VNRKRPPPASGKAGARRIGRLTGWNGARGFGFLQPEDGGPDAFAHVSAFARDDRLIEEGHAYIYFETRDAAGRLRADDVRPLRPLPEAAPGGVSIWVKLAERAFRLLVIPAFALLAGALAAHPSVTISSSWWVVYGAASLACFIGYGLDKRAAERGNWRVSETILILLGLAGGWPGALIAQETFRHKTRKISFRTLF